MSDYRDIIGCGPSPESPAVEKARELRDFAARNLEDAIRNVDLARLAAKSAEANYRAALARANR